MDSSIGRQIAEGYLCVPADTVDQWGELSRFADQGIADLLARLDLEEQPAGGKPR